MTTNNMNTLDAKKLTSALNARTAKAVAADPFAERAFKLERNRWSSAASHASFTLRTAAYIAASILAYATDADWYHWQKASSALPETFRKNDLTFPCELSDDSALTFYANHDFSWRLWKNCHPTFEWFVILTRRLFPLGIFEQELREEFLKFVVPGLKADGSLTFTQMNQALVMAMGVTRYLLGAQSATEMDCVTRHVPAIEATILTALDACGGRYE